MDRNRARTGLRTVGCRRWLTDSGRVVGYADDGFEVRVIPAATARDIIRRNHYSGTVVNNSYVHLGVIHQGRLAGVLQWGYAMNPNSGARVVPGTANRGYLELNRMWLSDAIPRNGESKAISYALRFIRQAYPMVRWVQSFADERCRGLGVVYQAANFLYAGYHVSTFYELDGVWYHSICRNAVKRGGRRGMHLRANLDRATVHKLRQFRYLAFLDPRARAACRLTILPYPKPQPRQDEGSS
jgi:hypothetical protein